MALTALACGPAASTAPPVSPAPSAVSSVAPGATASTSASATPASAAGQTDTDWGRIWDTLPAGFPTYPGAARSDEAQTAPSSGVDVINGKEAAAVVTWYRNALQAASYSTDAPAGPLEDGGYTLDATGTAGCRLELKIAPLGGLTSVTILYGATCRH